MKKKSVPSFAQTLRAKMSDEEMLYPLALVVARRQMKLWWDTPLHRKSSSPITQ